MLELFSNRLDALHSQQASSEFICHDVKVCETPNVCA